MSQLYCKVSKTKLAVAQVSKSNRTRITLFLLSKTFTTALVINEWFEIRISDVKLILGVAQSSHVPVVLDVEASLFVDFFGKCSSLLCFPSQSGHFPSTSLTDLFKQL